MAVGSVSGYSFPIGSTLSASELYPAKKVNSTEIDKSDFLKLLVAQLKNQDPTNPVKNEDFVAQLATFSSLEQLVAIKAAVNMLAGITTDENQDSTNFSN